MSNLSENLPQKRYNERTTIHLTKYNQRLGEIHRLIKGIFLSKEIPP